MKKKLISLLIILSIVFSCVSMMSFEVLAAETTYSGTCGPKLTWKLDSNTGVLTISGTGEMSDYSYYSYPYAPWNNQKTAIETLVIDDGVTSIGDYAFRECSSLTSITIPDSVTSIGDYVFSWCSSLTSITIPDSVTSIGYYAFYECRSLTSITIPDGVTSIGSGAFYYCSRLTSITIPDSVTDIGSYAFSYCNNVTLYVKENSYAHKYAVENKLKYYFGLVGDIDKNGTISLADRVILSRFIAKWDNVTLSDTYAADINKDGKITIIDRMILSRYLAGWDGYETYFTAK